jgi:N utilization substance protein B
MQALYQVDLSKGDIANTIEGILESAEYHPETKSFATDLSVNTFAKIGELSTIIETYSKGWALDRINPIDKALLRLALYEIIYDNTPHQVVVNEILEISKRYSTDDSPKFINGILGEFIKNEQSEVSKEGT